MIIFIFRNIESGVFFNTCSENFYKIHCKISVIELRFWIVWIVMPNLCLATSDIFKWGVFLYIFLYPQLQDTPAHFLNDFNKCFFSLSCQTVYCFSVNISSQFFVWCEFMNLVIEMSLVSRLNFFKTFFRRYLGCCPMVLL